MQTDKSVEEYQNKADDEFSRLAMNSGPLLSSEKISKAPWRPKVAGTIAFFFGPIAGALVVAISLRRMQHQQGARKVMLLALGMTAAEGAILFFIPDILSRLVGFGAEIAFIMIFPVLMEKEFTAWQASHPGSAPSNGWKAIGWGLIGVALFLVVLFLVFIVLGAVLPGRV